MLKENDCQTIEELKNLVLFLNNENKRLHTMNMDSLKKINILSVRVKSLEKISKKYDQFYASKKKYKNKLKELERKSVTLKNYTVRILRNKRNYKYVYIVYSNE